MRIMVLFAVILCCTMVAAAADKGDGQEVSLQLFIPVGEVQQYGAYPIVVAVRNRSKETLDFSQRMLFMEESEFRTGNIPDGAQLVLVFQARADQKGGWTGSLPIPPYKGVQIAPRETGLVMNHIMPMVIHQIGTHARILALRNGKVIGSVDWSDISIGKK